METIKYIAFEGIERSGKTTQAKKTTDFLGKLGYNAAYVKAGGLGGNTSWLQKIRNVVLTDYHTMTATMRMRYFDVTAKLQNREIKKRISNGALVVGDKSFWSCLVWEEINGICRLGRNGKFVYPNMVFYIDAEPQLIQQRIVDSNNSSVLDLSLNIDCLYNAVNKYRHLCACHKSWQLINGNLDKNGVWRQIESKLTKVFAK